MTSNALLFSVFGAQTFSDHSQESFWQTSPSYTQEYLTFGILNTTSSPFIMYISYHGLSSDLISGICGSNIPYTDALFFSSGAATQSGLNTIRLQSDPTYTQISLVHHQHVADPIVIHTFVVLVRLYWFEKRFQHIVRDTVPYAVRGPEHLRRGGSSRMLTTRSRVSGGNQLLFSGMSRVRLAMMSRMGTKQRRMLIPRPGRPILPLMTVMCPPNLNQIHHLP